ncbi:MAG: hypothetical protein O2944_08395 [Proteobacteria bacterium]|nr:hypothetical protein [Pseudomonadota bacterium]
MIFKHSTLVLILSAAAISVSLFVVKHQVQALDDDLVGINRGITNTREGIHVLKAEWSHLNQPARLRALAGRYLEVGPPDVERIGSAERIIDPLPERGEIGKAAETADAGHIDPKRAIKQGAQIGNEADGANKLQAVASSLEGTKP